MMIWMFHRHKYVTSIADNQQRRERDRSIETRHEEERSIVQQKKKGGSADSKQRKLVGRSPSAWISGRM
jgi:hypothetical protein